MLVLNTPPAELRVLYAAALPPCTALTMLLGFCPIMGFCNLFWGEMDVEGGGVPKVRATQNSRAADMARRWTCMRGARAAYGETGAWRGSGCGIRFGGSFL